MTRERWDRLFEDLEGQAAAIADAERWGEVDDRIREEAAGISLSERLRSSVEERVRVRCRGGLTAAGTIARIGRDWMSVYEPAGHEILVVLESVLTVQGVRTGAGKQAAELSVDNRLSLRHAVRTLVRDRSPVRIHLCDGTAVDGSLDAIGANYVQVALYASGDLRRRGAVRSATLVNLAGIVAFRREIL